MTPGASLLAPAGVGAFRRRGYVDCSASLEHRCPPLLGGRDALLQVRGGQRHRLGERLPLQRGLEVRPVSSRSRACASPTTRGSRYVAAIPACMPSLTNGAPSVADAAAYRRSHARARHNPAPMAGPFTAAIVGTSSRLTDSQAR